MIELIVIRHGETELNRQHRFQGQIDAPLNAVGERQALRLAQRLADERFDTVLASDLVRARLTAALATGADIESIAAESAWREQAFGVLEGLDAPSIMQRHPDLWAQWIRHEADFALPGGGESVLSFQQRVLAAVAALERSHAGRRVLVFTHGGVLDMLWRAAQGLPLHGPRQCDIPNTGINRLRCRGGRIDILAWGDAAHLNDQAARPRAILSGATATVV